MGFEQFWKAAKEKNADALNKLLEQGLSIDEWKIGKFYFSAVTALAAEGDHASVRFLVAHGADINYVAIGAAMAKNRAHCEALLSIGASTHFVAFGAAVASDERYLKILMERGIPNPEVVAQGLIMSGHFKLFDTFLFNISQTKIVQWAAMGGHTDYVTRILQTDLDPQMRMEVTIHAFIGAAFGGYKSMIDTIFNEYQGNRYPAGNDALFQGAALGGQVEMIELLTQNPLPFSGESPQWNADWDPPLQEEKQAFIDYAVTSGHMDFLVKFGAIIGTDLTRHLSAADALMAAYVGKQTALVNRISLPIDDLETIGKAIANGYNRRRTAPAELLPLFSSYTGNMESLWQFVSSYHNNDDRTAPSADLVRAKLLFSHRQEGLSYPLAFMTSNPNYSGMLYMMLVNFVKSTTQLPIELWLHIFNFITPVQITNSELRQLSIFSAKQRFCPQAMQATIPAIEENIQHKIEM